MNTRTVRIDRMGARGDGIADADGGPFYVPFALPGEMVTAEFDKNMARQSG